MQTIPFDNFTVYEDEENYTFIHLNIKDEEDFYKGLFDYFFDETKMLSYVENNKRISFEPSRKAYTILYRELKRYIDEENIVVNIPEFEKEIQEVLEIERIITFENGIKVARNDKIGKIGEYIFNVILRDYFDFDCVIPKVHLQTDYNMSVFGIDTIYYSEKDDMILFGESKCSVSLQNGIRLLKESLKDYEKQITDEYELVLCNRLYGDKLNIFAEKYGDYTEVCVDFKEFIDETGVNKVGIPLFVAHGTELDTNDILKKLKTIPRKKILGLDTFYYAISLPIFDKQKMITIFTNEIRKKECLYDSLR